MGKETGSFLGVKKLQSAILFTVMMVFIGYIFIWFTMPTNTFFLHWLPEIHAKTDSTYFGLQGLNFTLPFFLFGQSLLYHKPTKNLSVII